MHARVELMHDLYRRSVVAYYDMCSLVEVKLESLRLWARTRGCDQRPAHFRDYKLTCFVVARKSTRHHAVTGVCLLGAGSDAHR
jgi:hypothetical protein